MWFIDRNREQLMEFFHSGVPTKDIYFEDPDWMKNYVDRSGVVRLVWTNSPMDGNSPSLVVVPRGELREFFAWTNTYLPNWRPISSLIRVVSSDIKYQMPLSSNSVRPLLGFECGALGLVLGEALTYRAVTNRKISHLRISIGACMATCSFGLGRWIGLGRKFTPRIGQYWFCARKVLNQPSLGLDPQAIMSPWAVLDKIASRNGSDIDHRTVPSAVFKMCESIHAKGVIDEESLAVITKGFPDLRGAFQQMEGPWERRISVLDRALKATMQKRRNLPDSIVFGCGLLASRIDSGTLDHAGLLVPYLRHAKGLLLWYGLCAGLVQNTRVIEFSENLGRRVLRDMFAEETIFSVPRCDISLDEIEVLSVSKSSISNLKNGVSGQLTIEILPCVTTAVRWPSVERRSMDVQRSLFEQEATEMGDIVQELDKSLGNVRRRLREFRSRR